MLGYTWTGPVDPSTGITADQSSDIGTAILNAYQQGVSDATPSVQSTQSFSAWLNQNKTAIVGAAAALLLLAFVSSQNR